MLRLYYFVSDLDYIPISHIHTKGNITAFHRCVRIIRTWTEDLYVLKLVGLVSFDCRQLQRIVEGLGTQTCLNYQFGSLAGVIIRHHIEIMWRLIGGIVSYVSVNAVKLEGRHFRTLS